MFDKLLIRARNALLWASEGSQWLPIFHPITWKLTMRVQQVRKALDDYEEAYKQLDRTLRYLETRLRRIHRDTKRRAR